MPNRDLTIDPEFRDLLGPLLPDERERLELSLLQDGCREPIIVWANHDDTIIDGYNRYDLCLQNDLPFTTKAMRFETREDVLEWIISNQLGRRNLTEAKRMYLIGLDYRAKKRPRGGDRSEQSDTMSLCSPSIEIAEKNGVEPRTVLRNAKFSEALDDAAEKVDVNIKSAVLNEQVKASTKSLEELAALPKPAQRKAAAAIKAGEVKSVAQAVELATAVAPAEDVQSLEERAAPYHDAVAAINRILRDFEALAGQERTGAYLSQVWVRVKTDLKAAKGTLYNQTPHRLHGPCKGAGCNQCAKTGFITRFAWEGMSTAQQERNG